MLYGLYTRFHMLSSTVKTFENPLSHKELKGGNYFFADTVYTGSLSVVKECQQNFNFLSIESHLEIRTAKFLQAFSATKNTICLLFKHCAVTQLNSIFDRSKPNVIHSASQLARILRYNLS